MRRVETLSRLPRNGTFSRKIEKTVFEVPGSTLADNFLDIHRADSDEIWICYSPYGGGGWKIAEKN